MTKRTVVPASAVPHDRGPVPLAAFVSTVEELNRGLAAFAGFALLFVALGGAVVLVAARRQLARMKRFVAVVLASLVLAPGAAATPTVSFTMSGTAGSNGWFRSNVTINWVVTELGSVTSSTGCELAQHVTTEGSSSHTCTVTFDGGSTSAIATPKIDKTAPRRLRRDARARSRRERLVQPSRGVRVLGSGRNVRDRRLLVPVLRRRRRRLGVGYGHVHRCRRQREPVRPCRSSTTRRRRRSRPPSTGRPTERAGTGSPSR